MIRKTLLFAFVALVMASAANAATIVGIYLDPGATAGAGATSTRTGPGTFHLYGIDANDQGIANYGLTMGPAVTASNHRSPATTITDTNTDNQSAGFTLLRSSSNAAVMAASQNLAGQTPYLIKGYGVTAGSFAAVSAGDPGSVVVGPSTSASWGGPYVNGTLSDGPAGKKWVFLGEGTYNGTASSTTAAQIVAAANVLVYTSPTGGNFTQGATTTSIIIIPEPATLSLLGLAMVACVGLFRRNRT